MIKYFKNFLIIIVSIFVFSCKNKNGNHSNEYTNSLEKKLPDNSLLNQMNIAYNMDDYYHSIKYLDTLIKNDSTNGEYFYKKGFCESGLRNTVESIEAYKMAIKYHYRVTDATFSVAVNYTLLNDSIAKLYFEKCLTIDSNYQPAKTQLKVIKEHKKKVDFY